MKIVIASDSFKGCLSSREVAETTAQAILACCPDTIIDQVLVADGGEGTVDALVASSNEPVTWVSCNVDAPLRELPQVEARYAIDSDGTTAYMELAAASGLTVVPADCRDIMRSNTLGTGQMILDAIDRGCRHIIMGLGGSATCDGGMGLLAALGVEFIDTKGHLLYPCDENLGKINEIDLSGISNDVTETLFTLLTDVDNPLCGPRGAAHVFAPQKGATPSQVELIEQGMEHFARFLGDGATFPGGGAAGGVAAGMSSLLTKCKAVMGAPYIMGRARLASRIADADLVITGEGRIDGQTAMGKAPHAVSTIARQYNVPVVAICGAVTHDANASALGFKQIIPVTPTDMPLDRAMQASVARNNIARAITKYFTK